MDCPGGLVVVTGCGIQDPLLHRRGEYPPGPFSPLTIMPTIGGRCRPGAVLAVTKAQPRNGTSHVNIRCLFPPLCIRFV